MKILENLKLDMWYGIILYLGVALFSASLLLKPEFIQPKQLMGLGIGMFLIGIGYVISEKHQSEFVNGGILSIKINKHNFISITLIIIGFGLTCLFGFKLIQELIQN